MLWYNVIKTRIAELYVKLGIPSRYSFAQSLGIHRASVSNLLDNEDLKRIELFSIERLCKVYNVMPNDLFLITNDDGTEWKPK